MKIRWFGHSCFLFTNSQGKKIITDPFDTSVGYPLPEVEADIVTVSHSHFDHNAINIVKGKPIAIEGEGESSIYDITIKGISTYHDEEKGKKRGTNTIFIIETDGIRITHLGDLGHNLTEEHKEKIGRVDILCIPVGGTFTIDAEGAAKIVEFLKPKIVIPMHYKTPHSRLDIDTVDKFLKRINYPVKRWEEKEVEVIKETIPANTEVWMLSY
ncbi:MAG: MBL fold metallo-hydrolase [Dictyoglomaceae bacterium]|nr:MBL fold metallo-hydrolase [Dictyoglomaceae bacterium]